MPLFVSKGLNCISHQVLKNAKKLSLLTFDYYFGNIDLNVYLIILEKRIFSSRKSLNILLRFTSVNLRGSSTFSVVHCGGDVEFTDGEVEHGD